MAKILIAVALAALICLIWSTIQDWLERRKEKELNAVRFKAPTSRQKREERNPGKEIEKKSAKIKAMMDTTVYTYRFMGYLDSTKKYETGDVVIMNGDYYVYIDGTWQIIAHNEYHNYG